MRGYIPKTMLSNKNFCDLICLTLPWWHQMPIFSQHYSNRYYIKGPKLTINYCTSQCDGRVIVVSITSSVTILYLCQITTATITVLAQSQLCQLPLHALMTPYSINCHISIAHYHYHISLSLFQHNHSGISCQYSHHTVHINVTLPLLSSLYITVPTQSQWCQLPVLLPHCTH